MPAYEEGLFDPPAAVIRARVIGLDSEAGDVPLLVDSGSDVSTVPASVARAVGAQIAPSGIALLLIDDRHVSTNQADLAIEFLRFRVRGPFLVTESEYGVLGRNILNTLKLVLDGPRRQWSITDG